MLHYEWMIDLSNPKFVAVSKVILTRRREAYKYPYSP